MEYDHDKDAQEDEEEAEEEFHSSSGNLLETKTSQLDDLLHEKLEEAFHTPTSKVRLHLVAKIASEHTAIDLAYAVSRLPAGVRHVVYENLPDMASKVSFIINTDSSTRTAIFRHISDADIKTLIQGMPPDEAVWVLDDLSDRRFRRVLDLLDFKQAVRIRELQKHDRHSAGRLMTNEFFAFTMDVTIGDVAAYIRNHPGVDLTRRIFVLNHAGELLGYVPDRNLIVNPPQMPLRQVMRSISHSVLPDASRDEVVDLVERYKISALPVVDEDNFLVGVITYEDVVEVIEDIADETIARIAGTGEHTTLNEPLFIRIMKRAPWLVVTLFGGVVNAASLSYFQRIEAKIAVFLVNFVPLITGMSGNVGIQCSTVLVRGMATGALSSGNKGRVAMREIIIGTTIGVVFGILCGLLIWVLSLLGIEKFHANPLETGIIVSTGLFAACCMATCLGVGSPFFFARIGIDPAVASGPIVTACTDVMSMMMYFVVAQVIISIFL